MFILDDFMNFEINLALNIFLSEVLNIWRTK